MSSKTQYEKLLQDLDTTFGLLKTYNIIVHPSSRLNNYKKILLELIENKITNNLSKFQEKNGVWVVFQLKEIGEITSILNTISLHQSQRELFIKKLKIIVNGPEITLNESSRNNEPRNTQFELKILSLFYGLGYNKIEIHESKPDLSILTSNHKYAVECKRILSEDKLEKNTIGAYNQLLLLKNNFYAGLIALDVSTLLEKGHKWLVGKDENDFREKANQSLEIYLRKIYDIIKKKKLSDKFLIGVLLNLNCCYYIKDFEHGIINQVQLLTLNAESPAYTSVFNSDFKKFIRRAKKIV